MGRFYHNSGGFLMLCVQNVCVESVFNFSKSNFEKNCDDVGITSVEAVPLMIFHQSNQNE